MIFPTLKEANAYVETLAKVTRIAQVKNGWLVEGVSK